MLLSRLDMPWVLPSCSGCPRRKKVDHYLLGIYCVLGKRWGTKQMWPLPSWRLEMPPPNIISVGSGVLVTGAELECNGLVHLSDQEASSEKPRGTGVQSPETTNSIKPLCRELSTPHCRTPDLQE